MFTLRTPLVDGLLIMILLAFSELSLEFLTPFTGGIAASSLSVEPELFGGACCY